MTKWLSENRKTSVRVLGSVLALVLLIVLLEEEGDGKLFSALRRVSIGYFLAAIVSLFISRLFAVSRWHILLQSAGVKIPFLRSIMLTFTGNFSSNLLPTTVGGDLLISTYYASYAYFVGMPVFSKIYPYIYYEQTRDEINSIVEQNDSGWIVMDNTTGLYFSELPVETFDVNDKIVEYLGSFGDQMIWSWNRSR